MDDTVEYITSLENDNLPCLNDSHLAQYKAENERHRSLLRNVLKLADPVIHPYFDNKNCFDYLKICLINDFIATGAVIPKKFDFPIICFTNGFFSSARLVAFYFPHIVHQVTDFHYNYLDDDKLNILEKSGYVSEFSSNFLKDFYSTFGTSRSLHLDGAKYYAKWPCDYMYDGIVLFGIFHEIAHLILGHQTHISAHDDIYRCAIRYEEFEDAIQELNANPEIAHVKPNRRIKRNFFGFQTQEIEADIFAIKLLIAFLNKKSPKYFAECPLSPHLIGVYFYLQAMALTEIIHFVHVNSLAGLRDSAFQKFPSAHNLFCRPTHPDPARRLIYILRRIQLLPEFEAELLVRNFSTASAIWTRSYKKMLLPILRFFHTEKNRPSLPPKWNGFGLDIQGSLGLSGRDSYLHDVRDECES